MAYTIETAFFSKKANLWTTRKTYSHNGNRDFDLESVKDILDQWCYDGEMRDGEIVHENGDKTSFAIYYNGRFCKKYTNGIK